MNLTKHAVASLFTSSFVAIAAIGALACGASTSSGTGTVVDPPASTNDSPLAFTSPCAADTCGAMNMVGCAAGTVEQRTCAPNASKVCTWSLTCKGAPSGSVSYRPCESTACGTEPTASVCPSGTVFHGSTCGSENDAACAWTTHCTPPPSTEACPNPDGCGAQPTLGVICGDGGTGSLVCMKQGASCGWERSCP